MRFSYRLVDTLIGEKIGAYRYVVNTLHCTMSQDGQARDVPGLRPCIDCRRPTMGTRCPACHAAYQAPARAVYDDPRWHALSQRTVRDWIATYGPVCPGYGRPPHVSHKLTGDHRIPIAQGGEPFDPRNVTVLCRGCNGRKRDA